MKKTKTNKTVFSKKDAAKAKDIIIKTIISKL